MGDMVMGECKDKQIKSYITQTYCTHVQGKYGRLLFGNVYMQWISSKNAQV